MRSSRKPFFKKRKPSGRVYQVDREDGDEHAGADQERAKAEKAAAVDPKVRYLRALDGLTRLLALRDHSRFELRQKLSRRHEKDVIDQVMNEAEESGWLLPEAEVAEKAAAALGRKLKSRRYIEGSLRKKQLAPPPKEEGAEEEKIRQLVEKKFGTEKMNFEERNKAYRFLRYRGFDDRAIRTVLNEIGKE